MPPLPPVTMATLPVKSKSTVMMGLLAAPPAICHSSHTRIDRWRGVSASAYSALYWNAYKSSPPSTTRQGRGEHHPIYHVPQRATPASPLYLQSSRRPHRTVVNAASRSQPALPPAPPAPPTS